MKENREYRLFLNIYIHDFYYLLSLYFNNFLKLSGYKFCHIKTSFHDI